MLYIVHALEHRITYLSMCNYVCTCNLSYIITYFIFMMDSLYVHMRTHRHMCMCFFPLFYKQIPGKQTVKGKLFSF